MAFFLGGGVWQSCRCASGMLVTRVTDALLRAASKMAVFWTMAALVVGTAFAASFFLFVSSHNYPGGDALAHLHATHGHGTGLPFLGGGGWDGLPVPGCSPLRCYACCLPRNGGGERAHRCGGGAAGGVAVSGAGRLDLL